MAAKLLRKENADPVNPDWRSRFSHIQRSIPHGTLNKHPFQGTLNEYIILLWENIQYYYLYDICMCNDTLTRLLTLKTL